MNAVQTYFENQFLIAMPGLADPYFSRTVTYLCQHNAEGALGIIVNRPSELTLMDIMRQMEISVEYAHFAAAPVYFGGPVQPDRGFILHNAGSQWSSTLKVSDSVSLTTSRDILEAMAVGQGPEKALLALGYAGWSQGQLEQEIMENAWLNVPVDDAIVFDVDASDRWKRAADSLGVDISRLTAHPGHG